MSKYIILIVILLLLYLIKDSNVEHYKPLPNNDFFNYLENNGYTINKNNKFISKNNKLLNYNYNFNKKKPCKIVLHKDKLSKLLYSYNSSVPKFINITEYDENYILNKISSFKFPLVVKPTDGSLGIGVETDIYKTHTLLKIIKKSLQKYNIIQIEEQVQGDGYRILVFNHKIIDIIKKNKANIIGDGKTSVRQLIYNKYHNYSHKIKPNSRLLESQNVNLDSVVPFNRKVDISNIINMQNGAECERIDIDKIPDINKNLFIDVTKKIDIFCTGIDFISTDINIPYTINKARILELNYKPDITIHLNNEPVKNDFYNTILKNM